MLPKNRKNADDFAARVNAARGCEYVVVHETFGWGFTYVVEAGAGPAVGGFCAAALVEGGWADVEDARREWNPGYARDLADLRNARVYRTLAALADELVLEARTLDAECGKINAGALTFWLP